MTAKVRGHLNRTLIAIVPLLAGALSAAPASADRLSMPWRCEVTKGRVLLQPTPGTAVDYAIVGQRESRPYSVCSGLGAADCPRVTLHRLTIQCGATPVRWLDVAQALLTTAAVPARLDNGRLVVAAPPSAATQPCPPPDRPVAPFHLGHRVGAGELCALQDRAGEREIVLPEGFAPLDELGAHLVGSPVAHAQTARLTGAAQTSVPPPAVVAAAGASPPPSAVSAPGRTGTAGRTAAAGPSPVAGASVGAAVGAGPAATAQAAVAEPTPSGPPRSAVAPVVPAAAAVEGGLAGTLSNALALRKARADAVETSPLPDISAEQVHGHAATSSSATPTTGAEPIPAPAIVGGGHRPAAAGVDTAAPMQLASVHPEPGLEDGGLPALPMVALRTSAPWPLAPEGLVALLAATALLASTTLLLRARRRLPAPAIAVPELLPLVVPSRQPLLAAAPQIEALCDQTLGAIATLEAAPPLQEVLDGEVRQARQRLAVAVAAVDGGDDGPRRAAAMCRNIVRDLDRVRRITDSAIASFRSGASDRIAPPATCAEAYAVLGVNPDVGDATLKKLADALRMSWHPDHARDDVDRARREARTKQINIALDMIRGSRQRGAA